MRCDTIKHFKTPDLTVKLVIRKVAILKTFWCLVINYCLAAGKKEKKKKTDKTEASV